MYVNTIGDFIKSVLPSKINKNDPVLKALLADDGNSTLENILNDFEAERKKWCNNSSVYTQTDEQLKKTMNLISVLSRFDTETEKSFIKRNELLFYRLGDKVWGTKWNILKIFKSLIGNDNVYLVNNTELYEDSILLDGNFERKNAWTLNGCTYEREARFDESIGILFNKSGTCSQSVSVNTNKSYFLHFFIKGKIRVKIQDLEGKHWNPNKGEFGDWTEAEYLYSFSSTEWNDSSLFFITNNNVNNVKITFVYHEESFCFLDYVRLFLKSRASTFSIIAIFEGLYSDDTVSLAPGKDDPINDFNFEKMGYLSAKDVSDYDNVDYIDQTTVLAPKTPLKGDDFKGIDYEKVSYFENSFIAGPDIKTAEEIYKEILDIIQPAGVTSFVEVLTRESDGV
ncbi:MAG: hypothetical protein ACRC4W_00210 [Treponemataceae bacterium]